MFVVDTLNIVFIVTYYLELRSAIHLSINVLVYQGKMLMFYNVQTTNLTLLANNEIYTKQPL